MPTYLSFPVADVERSRAFYAALGWTPNDELSSTGAACFAFADDQFVMALSRAAYEEVGGTEELVGGPGTPSPVTVSFTVDSREALDALLASATAAGARIGETEDDGFMIQIQFDDPDGYHYSPFWVNPDAPEPAADA